MADLSSGEYQRILDLTVAILDNDEPDLPWRLILDEVRVSLASATSLLFWTQGWVDAPPDDFPVPHREPRASPRSAPPPSPLPTRSMGPDLDAQFHRHPLVRHYQVAPDPMPRTVEDLHRDGRWPDEAAQHAVTEYLEADRHLAVPLPAPPGEGRVIVLGRAGRGFTDRDRHLAARWQPLLAAALNQQRQIDRWRAQASAAQGVPPEAMTSFPEDAPEVVVDGARGQVDAGGLGSTRGGLLRPDAPVALRCAVIEAERATYPIVWMCRLLRVPRSSFHAWRTQFASEGPAPRWRPTRDCCPGYFSGSSAPSPNPGGRGEAGVQRVPRSTGGRRDDFGAATGQGRGDRCGVRHLEATRRCPA